MTSSSSARSAHKHPSISIPTHPSLEPESELFTTRGQRLPGLVTQYSLSTSQQPSQQDSQEFMKAAEDGGIGTESFLQTRRGMRLIGTNNNPRYQWHRYYKPQEELQKMRRPIREYYEQNNYLISQYLYIDLLLDSPLPQKLVEEYNANEPDPLDGNVPPASQQTGNSDAASNRSPSTKYTAGNTDTNISTQANTKIRRTPRNLYRIPSNDVSFPLFLPDEERPLLRDYASTDRAPVATGDPIVRVAIWVNLIANVLLLIAKVAATVMTSSVSVLASLVDGALDFLSTAIIWTTTNLVVKHNRYKYPAGRQRLEPLGILVFSVVMVTSFFQVALTSLQRLTSPDHTLIGLNIPAIGIMAGTVVIKLFCWLWCRLVKNSGVQALAQDAMTDVVFNFFSIVFPVVGMLVNSWFLDPLGGLLLSVYIIWNWGTTAVELVRTLTGAAASPYDRNILLYMTMRFAKLIKKIQGLEVYHAGNKLIAEVDIVLDEKTQFRDIHDLGESLQYMLESVPTVDRAFVHSDYASRNFPTHMNQQE